MVKDVGRALEWGIKTRPLLLSLIPRSHEKDKQVSFVLMPC